MINQSTEEYKIVCDLTKMVVDDISKYSSLIFTSSGAAIVGIGAFVTSYFNDVGLRAAVLTHAMEAYLAISSAAVSIITLFMLLIVLYKCDSHNRLVGYRTLLSSEIVEEEMEKLDTFKEIHSIDFCIGKMRAIANDKENLWNNYVDFLPGRQGRTREMTDEDVIRQIYVHYPDIENLSMVKGRKIRSIDNSMIRNRHVDIIRQTLLMKTQAGSWSMPRFVTVPVFYMAVAEGILSLYMGLSRLTPNDDCKTIFIMVFSFMYLASFSYLTSKIWFQYCQIMVGSGTIDSYVWRFIPVRCRYIFEISKGEVRPYYI